MCIQVLWPDEALGRLEQNHLFMKMVVILFQRSSHYWYSLSVSAISKLLPASPPNDMATLTSPFQQVQTAGSSTPLAGQPGPSYCPYYDKEGDKDMAHEI